MYPALVRFARKWHRWIAWGFGLVIVMWFATGILMVYPYAALKAKAPPSPPIPLDAAILPPFEVVQRLVGRDASTEVRSLSLRQIGEVTVYVINVGGRAHVLDARSGAPFVLPESTAVRMIGQMVGTDAPVAGVRLVERPERGYDGAVPAVRVALGDPSGTVAYMSNAGEVRFVNASARAKALAGRLHSFDVSFFKSRHEFKRWSLIVTGIVSLLLALSGYLLLLPARRRHAA